MSRHPISAYPSLLLSGIAITASLLLPTDTIAAPTRLSSEKARIVEHWNAARRAAAIPRDLLIDRRGLGYLRLPDGSFQPYGHQVAAEKRAPLGDAQPMVKPGTIKDTTPPEITALDPANGAVIGSAHTFAATITDESGIKSVTFTIRYPDGVTTQQFTPTLSSADNWSIALQGFTDSSDWAWWVDAKDSSGGRGNTATSDILGFSVDTGSSGGGDPGSGDTITNAAWSDGGEIQSAAGRIYFEMPANKKRKGPWSGYVCSGTVVQDGTSGRSIVLTAAHCIYDDINKAFARNVLFIPDQAGTSGSATDLNCDNDPLGCWLPSFGVVDRDWTTRTFPDNIAWDYAFYVVDDSGAHAGTDSAGTVLDSATAPQPLSFSVPFTNDGVPGADSIDFTHALGYSYSADPNFMYCAEDMTENGQYNWWLASCGLSGGASGGPWIQPMDTAAGSGPVISVNSWGYTTEPGMAGPKLIGSTECLFTMAKSTAWSAVSGVDGEAGVAASCP